MPIGCGVIRHANFEQQLGNAVDVRRKKNDVGGPRLDIHNSEVPNLCRSCEARHKGICGALKDNELTDLARHTTRKTVAVGSQMQGEAESMETYANILSGVVKLTRVMSDGRQQIVGLQFAPDFLGRPFQETSKVGAEAASDVNLCAFPKSTLDRLLGGAPDLEHRLLKQTLQELDDAREWMLTLGRKTAAEKVASFLLLIAHHIDPEAEIEEADHAVFDLPLTRADIADFLGLTIETVSRQFTRLRKSGVIEILGSRRITVRSLAALRDVSGG